jgi:hypothetical protein
MKAKDTKVGYIPGHGDSMWIWNCGWRCVVSVNNRLRIVSKRVLGHAEFNKLRTTFPIGKEAEAISPASSSAFGRRAHGGDWQRWLTEEKGRKTVWEHDLFGEVYVLASDGVHAIVCPTHDVTIKYEAHVNNLIERVVSHTFEVSKRADGTEVTSLRRPRAPRKPSALAEKLARLEALLDEM